MPSRTVAPKGDIRKMAITDHGTIACESRTMAAYRTIDPPRPVDQ